MTFQHSLPGTFKMASQPTEVIMVMCLFWTSLKELQSFWFQSSQEGSLALSPAFPFPRGWLWATRRKYTLCSNLNPSTLALGVFISLIRIHPRWALSSPFPGNTIGLVSSCSWWYPTFHTERIWKESSTHCLGIGSEGRCLTAAHHLIWWRSWYEVKRFSSQLCLRLPNSFLHWAASPLSS